jgi:hypothetical protein
MKCEVDLEEALGSLTWLAADLRRMRIHVRLQHICVVMLIPTSTSRCKMTQYSIERVSDVHGPCQMRSVI